MRSGLAISAFIGLATASAPSAADLPTSGPLSLAEVVGYAREHNPELEAARRRASAAHAVPAQAAAWDDPMVVAESWNSPRAIPYDEAENNILKLSQRLPFPGKLARKGRM